MQEGRLARAAFAHQGQALTALYFEIEVGEDDEIGGAGAVALGEVLRANENLGCAGAGHRSIAAAILVPGNFGIRPVNIDCTAFSFRRSPSGLLPAPGC